MTQLAEYLVHARVWLETQVGVAAPAGALVALVFLSQYLVRRFIPGVWESMANLPFPGGAHKPAVALLALGRDRCFSGSACLWRRRDGCRHRRHCRFDCAGGARSRQGHADTVPGW
jgi:hypothetical protein